MPPRRAALGPLVLPDVPSYHPTVNAIPPGTSDNQRTLLHRYGQLAEGLNWYLSVEAFVNSVQRPVIEGRLLRARASLSNLRDRVIEQMSMVIRGGEIPIFPRQQLNKAVAEKLGLPLLLNSTARGLAAAASNAEEQAQQLEARAAVNPELHQTATAARGTATTRRQHANRARDAAGVERAAVEAAPAPVVNAQAQAANHRLRNRFFALATAGMEPGGYVLLRRNTRASQTAVAAALAGTRTTNPPAGAATDRRNTELKIDNLQ